MLESKIWADSEQKAREFLRQVMGDDVFNKFIKEGKIEIQSNNITYELYNDGRVVNKTTRQNYCIVPDRSDYPSYDIIAIKFAWIKYGQKTVDKVANKTSLDNLGRRDNIGYAAFVDYMESRGWRREQLIIDELNTNVVATHSLERETTGTVIDIRCPASHNITVMGVNQVPAGADWTSADTIVLKIADKNDVEISGHTRIFIDKTRFDGPRIMLVRSFYSDFSLIRRINNDGIRIYKSFEEWYRWRAGIHLNGEDMLRINIVNSPIDIYRKNIKISMDMDYWTRY